MMASFMCLFAGLVDALFHAWWPSPNGLEFRGSVLTPSVQQPITIKQEHRNKARYPKTRLREVAFRGGAVPSDRRQAIGY